MDDFRKLTGPLSRPFEETELYRAAREERDREPLPDGARATCHTILDMVGGTPLLRLPRLEPTGGAQLYAKAEQLEPAGSVKDRICLAMIEAAERDGRLPPGGTVVEPTSGNTGIGLALVCAVKGYPLVLTMPASMSLERRQLLASFGAEIVLTEPEEAMEGAIRAAKAIAEERGAFMPMQFQNPANPAAHLVTGEEVLASLDAEGVAIDAFVAGVGTGGTITGVGRTLRQRWPALDIVAVEPEASAVLSGKPPGPTKIQGLAAGFVPEVLDTGIYDRVVTVSDRDAWETKLRLGREEGLLVGISSGANVFAAIALAKRLGPGKRVLTFLCDTGERYFSLGEYFS